MPAPGVIAAPGPAGRPGPARMAVSVSAGRPPAARPAAAQYATWKSQMAPPIVWASTWYHLVPLYVSPTTVYSVGVPMAASIAEAYGAYSVVPDVVETQNGDVMRITMRPPELQ